MAETPHYAHFVALIFLGSSFVIFVCLLIAAVAAISKTARVAKFAARGAALTGIGYAALLFAVAFASPNKTLPPGAWKYFCEADCHIAYSIESAQQASTLGPEAKPLTAQGRFVVIRLKTWFDENSVSSFRGNAPLRPNPRVVELIDDRGRHYLSIPQAAAAVAATSTPLTEPLGPGESYRTTLVFDLPADGGSPRLLVTDVDPVSYLLIDHENSPLHGKIYLALSPGVRAVASSSR